MRITAAIDGLEAPYLALEAAASEPYTSFVYDDRAQAEQVQQLLFARDVGDFARRFGRIALIDNAVVGMIACIPGRELAGARLKAAWALRQSGLLAGADVTRRTQIAGQAMAKVAADDFYLSRIAVAPDRRSGGLGRQLLAAYEAEARQAGAPRLVLEVSPVHRAALVLYQRAGFTIAGSVPVSDGARQLEYHHLTKQLAP